MTKQALAAQTFVQLIDSLVEDFDVIDLLTVLADRCIELFDAGAVGILLADSDGHLRVMAASSEQARLLELFQIQNDEGPCLECFRGGVVMSADLLAETSWPRFAAEAVNAGFRSVSALPLRLRNDVLGALNLFMEGPVAMSEDDLTLAQALADVATIAIAQDQVARESALRQLQLQSALDSRVVIEQAKGMIAESAKVDMDEAFSQLRARARNDNRRLSELAADVVAGVFAIGSLVGPAGRSGRQRPDPAR